MASSDSPAKWFCRDKDESTRKVRYEKDCLHYERIELFGSGSRELLGPLQVHLTDIEYLDQGSRPRHTKPLYERLRLPPPAGNDLIHSDISTRAKARILGMRRAVSNDTGG
jgi:hypothetical protein